MPVVRLRSSSEEGMSENDNENIDLEQEKEINTLKLLKSDLAAKAKEVLEKKIPKKIHTEIQKLPENKDHFDIPTYGKSTSPIENIENSGYKIELSSIKLIPLKKQIMSIETKEKREKMDSPKIDHDEFDIKSKEFIKASDSKDIVEKIPTDLGKFCGESKKEGRAALKIETVKRNPSFSSSRSRSRSHSREKSASKERKSRSSSRSSYR